MHTTTMTRYFPLTGITSDLFGDDEDFSTLFVRFASGTDSVSISVHAETPEMKALFAAIHSAINPAPSELPGEVAEYEAARNVTVCEDCGQAHG